MSHSLRLSIQWSRAGAIKALAIVIVMLLAAMVPWAAPSAAVDILQMGSLADSEEIPPEVSITSPLDGASLTTSTVMVEWSAWDNQTGLDHIEVTVDSYPPVDVGLNMSMDLTLTEGSHSIIVTAFDAMDNNGSDSVSFTVMIPTTPGVPMGVIVIESGGIVVLSWDAPEDDGGSAILGYSIAYGTSSDDLDSSVNEEETEHTFTDLPGGNTYYFTVTAMNNQGSGSASAMVNLTFVLVPSAPANPTGTEVDEGVQIDWLAPLDDGGSAISSYNIYRSIGTGSLSLLTIVNTTGYLDTDVSNNTTYHYLIRAVNSEGEGPSSLEVTVNYQIDEPDVDDGDGLDPYLLIIPVIIVLAILLMLMLWKRRKDKEEKS